MINQKPNKLKTNSYALREICSSDLENVFCGLSNPEITKFYDVHYSSREETQEQMEWYKNLKEKGTGIWWGIFGRKDDSFCGAAGFNDLNRAHRKAEIGFWLLKEYWGKGILKEVMPVLFDYGFSELNLNRIEGFVQGENEKCKRALNKIDFTYEGTMREYEIKNGMKIDLDIYAVLKKQWDNKIQCNEG